MPPGAGDQHQPGEDHEGEIEVILGPPARREGEDQRRERDRDADLPELDPAEPVEEASQFAESTMLDLWLDIPPSPQAKTLTVRRGDPVLPGHLELDESDLAPE